MKQTKHFPRAGQRLLMLVVAMLMTVSSAWAQKKSLPELQPSHFNCTITGASISTTGTGECTWEPCSNGESGVLIDGKDVRVSLTFTTPNYKSIFRYRGWNGVCDLNGQELNANTQYTAVFQQDPNGYNYNTFYIYSASLEEKH